MSEKFWVLLFVGVVVLFLGGWVRMTPRESSDEDKLPPNRRG